MNREHGVGPEDDDAVPAREYGHRRLGLHGFIVFLVEKVWPSDGENSILLCTKKAGRCLHGTGKSPLFIA